VWVPLPGAQAEALFAIAWLALHGLCTAVDTHLLGEDA
jgi:D-sedoheptulose 7-phosphate isomerase